MLFILTTWYNTQLRSHSSFFLKTVWWKIADPVYAQLVRPLLFLIQPEQIHSVMISSGRVASQLTVLRGLIQTFFGFWHPKLAIKKDGIRFLNPVGLAAGYDNYADMTQAASAIGFGFQTIGTITLEPYQSSLEKKMTRFQDSKGILVHRGPENLGATTTIAKLMQTELLLPTGISIGNSVKNFRTEKEQLVDLVRCFQLFEKSDLTHSFYELNFHRSGEVTGIRFTDPNTLEILLTAIDAISLRRPLYLKMPIDLSAEDSLALLHTAKSHAVAGVIFGYLTNDLKNPDVDAQDREKWQQSSGALSGKATFQRSNNLIRLTKKHFGSRYTIIGTGGIFTPEDAQIKLDLGADLIQLLTGMIYTGPQLIGKINMKLAKSRI